MSTDGAPVPRAETRSADAPAGGLRSSLRTQTLLPFAVGLVVIIAIIAVGAILIARASVDRELRTRAQSATRTLDKTLRQTRERVARDAERAAVVFPSASPADRAARLGLENRMVDFAEERRLALVSVSEGGKTLADGRREWRRLPFARSLDREAAARGKPVAGTGLSARGQPFVLAAAAGEEGQRVLVGTAIDQRVLSEVESPLGVLLHLSARPGTTSSSAGGLRTVSVPFGMDDGASPRLEVTVSNRPLSQATRSALITAIGAGLLMAVVLIALLAALLRRSVIDPLGALRRAIERMKGGDYGVRLAPAGPREMRAVSDGFNRMCALVGDQHDRLQTLATTDSLTGLANHRTFHDALARAAGSNARGRAPFALVMIDLDGFKELNDGCGHLRGDEVLRETAKALLGVVRESDIVGRIGGDEFGLLLAGADGVSAFDGAERARKAIREIGVADYPIDSSAGVAACPDDAVDGARLVEFADAALYQAKLAGRGRTSRFDPRVSGPAAVEERRAIVRDVLDRRALRTVFQPIVELTTGDVVGYEALSRFPGERTMGPAEWFALARTCGLGPELQAEALSRALATPGRPPGAWLALNVDPSALADPAVRSVLPEDLSGIVIEVTEQELLPDNRVLRREVEEMRARGALIALDDAGSGWAGLSHVVRVRPDIIKLDRSLVADVDKDRVPFALISAFVSFARETGAQVCAEGIETYEQLTALIEAEVMLGQGYVLARPEAPWATVAREISNQMPGWRRDPPGGAGGAPTLTLSSGRAPPPNGQMQVVTAQAHSIPGR